MRREDFSRLRQPKDSASQFKERLVFNLQDGNLEALAPPHRQAPRVRLHRLIGRASAPLTGDA